MRWPTRDGCCARRRPVPPRTAENTTLAVVATNARLTKPQAAKLAQMAHDGFARAHLAGAHAGGRRHRVRARHGARGTDPDDLLLVGALAADVTAEAILRAVRAATSVRRASCRCRDLGR